MAGKNSCEMAQMEEADAWGCHWESVAVTVKVSRKRRQPRKGSEQPQKFWESQATAIGKKTVWGYTWHSHSSHSYEISPRERKPLQITQWEKLKEKPLQNESSRVAATWLFGWTNPPYKASHMEDLRGNHIQWMQSPRIKSWDNSSQAKIEGRPCNVGRGSSFLLKEQVGLGNLDLGITRYQMKSRPHTQWGETVRLNYKVQSMGYREQNYRGHFCRYKQAIWAIYAQLLSYYPHPALQLNSFLQHRLK